MRFIVLDTLKTISGFSNQHQSGIYSNEVRNMGDLVVAKSFKGGLMVSGEMATVKDKVKPFGGKFASSAYCALIKKDGSMMLVNIKFAGGSLDAFIKLVKLGKMDDGSIISYEGQSELKKKGAVDYRTPILKKTPKDPQLMPAAIELDRQLQIYLNDYLKVVTVEPVSNEYEEEDLENEETQTSEDLGLDLPF
jgi:hypothetical protein